MPTTYASTIVSKAQLLVQDPGAVRWSIAEWVGWLNDAQREIAMIKVSAFTKTGPVPLVLGTKQSLPADAVLFLEYIRHMGVDGLTPGASARKVSRRVMDSVNPNWHSATKSSAPQHYIFEPLDPKSFYVYPPSTGGTHADVLYSAAPPSISYSDLIGLDDVYANAILDYMIYRAYLKDSESIGNAERAIVARKSFETSIGMKSAVDVSAAASDSVKG